MTASDPAPLPDPGFTIHAVRDHWDRVGEIYDRANEKIGYGHRQRFLHGLRYFTCGPAPRLLNIWARMGEAVPYLHARFPQGQFLHLEASAVMVAEARRRFPGETFHQTDLSTLPVESGAYDAVLSLETLEHCPAPARFLAELFRALRPGGELVLSCPSRSAEPLLRLYETFFENHGEGPHRFPWSWQVKRQLRATGFTLLEHRGTVFLPVIPDALAPADEFLGRWLGRTPLAELGIRQFYFCRKPPASPA